MKNKKNNNVMYIVGALVVVAVFTALISMSGSENSNNSAEFSLGQLASVSNSFDFGEVNMNNGDVAHVFEVSNAGSEPVRIEKVYTSCMCTKAIIKDGNGRKRGIFGMPGHGLSSKTNIEVLPGESIAVEAVFDPAAHGPSGVGLANRSIYLESNSQKSPKLELSFQAMVNRQ